MMKAARIVAMGLAVIGVAEIVVRGTDATFYTWYLLFVLWMAALIIRFIQAAISVYKAAFAKVPDGKMTFPEFEQKMASFSRGSDKDEGGPSSKANSGTGSQDGTEDLFDDVRVNPILREDDPFGEFFDS